MENQDENEKRLEKCLEIAIDNRKFEIDLFWRRTIIFWGFVAALLIGVSRVITVNRQLAIVLSAMGFIFSLIWTLVNRGSKSWYESWEEKADTYFIQLYRYKKMYKKIKKDEHDILFILRSRDYSLSRLLIALSDFSLIFWTGLLFYLMPIENLHPLISFLKSNVVIFFISFTFIYAIYILTACRGKKRNTITGDL